LPKSGTNKIDVIVRFKYTPTNYDLQQFGQNSQNGQSSIKKVLDIIRSVHVSLTPAQIQLLAYFPTVEYISPNRPMKKSLDITTSSVSANLAWNLGWTGAAVGVAVIDSGVAQKKDLAAANALASRVVYSQNIAPSEDGTDRYGHGTHV